PHPRAQALATGVVEGDAGCMHFASRSLTDNKHTRGRGGLHHRTYAMRQVRFADAAGTDGGEHLVNLFRHDEGYSKVDIRTLGPYWFVSYACAQYCALRPNHIG